MEIKSTKENIIFLQAESQYELCATFWRLQEYYESPKFRNKFFGIEEYMDWYAGEYGNFTYFSDWNGFNVPGNIVRKFFANTPHTLFDKESRMFELLQPWIEGNEKFYVIGIWKADNTLDHEISHALYYLDPAYKKDQTTAMENVPKEFRIRIAEWLNEKGYHPSVTEDETIAYLSTNTMADTVHNWGKDIPWNSIAPLQTNFYNRYEKYQAQKDDDKS